MAAIELRVLLLLCAGCGRIGFDAAADSDGRALDDGGTCTFSAWSAPAEVTELSSGIADSSAQVTSDGLTIYFSRGNEVYVARRTSRAVAWSPPQFISELSGVDFEYSASVSADELEVYLTRRVVTLTCLYTSRRASAATAWPAPTQMSAFCSGVEAGGSFLTRDGLRLYYTEIPSGAVEGRLMLASRATPTDTFTPGSPIAINTSMQIGYPTLTADELTIYFESDSPINLYAAARPTTSSPFDNVMPLGELDTPGFTEEDVSVTGDGLELYFDTDRPPSQGPFDIYMSTRTCL